MIRHPRTEACNHHRRHSGADGLPPASRLPVDRAHTASGNTPPVWWCCWIGKPSRSRHQQTSTSPACRCTPARSPSARWTPPPRVGRPPFVTRRSAEAGCVVGQIIRARRRNARVPARLALPWAGISPEAYCRGNETAEVLQTKDAQLSDKSPRSTMSKKQGKSIKEKRAEKKAKSAATESGVEALESRGKKRK